MKHEPRPSIHMEKHLGWACKLGGMECQDLQVGANSVSEVDGVSVVAPAFQLCASVVGCASVVEKGQWALPTILSGTKLSTSSYLDSRNFGSFLYATGDFQAAPQCWSSEGVSLSR